jgi:hypothetical protein
VLVIVGTALAPGYRARTGIPVDGEIAGQTVHTTVDALPAKRYLEDHLPRRQPLDEHDRAIAHALTEADSAPLTRPALQMLTARLSTDLATLYLVDRLYAEHNNRRLQNAFHERASLLRELLPTRVPAVPDALRSFLLVFVPGYAYKLDTTTGADFSRQRVLLEMAGFETVLIETDELGLVETNAAVIAREIVRLSKLRRSVVLVSASKGGPEVALALGEILRPDETNHVKAWISIGAFDHYYRDAEIDLKTLALAYVVLEELQRHSTPSPATPSDEPIDSAAR